MAAEDKVGGETTPKQGDKTATSRFPAYALYRYHANRPNESGALGGEDDPGEATVPDFLQKEATADGNFSLSLVSSGLKPENEAELRWFVAKRLSRGTVYSGTGNISSLELQVDDGEEAMATCYYCLLRQGAAIIPELGRLKASAMGDSYCSNEFVICFLTAGDVTLDLFKPELDTYSKNLLAKLDTDPVLKYDDEDANQVINADIVLRPHLECWPQDVMHFVCRCVSRLGEDIKYLIHAALLDCRVNVIGDVESTTDMKKFIECCSLSELLSQLTTEVKSNSSTPSNDLGPLMLGADDLSRLELPTQNSTETITLTLTKDGHTFDKHESSQFCEEWTRALLSCDADNPILMRQIIDNYKLKAIQDMNTLKRLIRQAETDHYALYRSYVFLGKCGHGSILLRHAWLEPHTLTSADGKQVLTVLDEYISETGGLMAR